MDEQRRRRTAIIWTAFAVVMAAITFSGGFAADVGHLLGVVAVILALGLAYVYYANPSGLLDFGETEP